MDSARITSIQFSMSNGADLSLLIDSVTFETPDILVLEFMALDHGTLPSWRAGAHIDLLL